MIPILPAQALGDCRQLEPPGWPPIAWSAEMWSSLWKAAAPGSGLVVRCCGTGLGVFDVIGPDSGILAITVDGRPCGASLRFDRFRQCFRRNYFMAAHSLPEGAHEVRVTLTPDMPDKAAIMGGSLGGDNVALYGNLAWYPAALMVLGRVEPG